ncbi:MAG TPA: carbonic anhydrase [Terriglobales bacterium]|jgi:carbonic anhydrase|nr:carbonic anhydrase [Terriglobales bacterium]
MPEIDEVLEANADFARHFTRQHLSKRPARRLAVLACMDARLNVEQALGLAPGDAHIIRNAGAIVSDDALRSLVLSHHELGTREIMILGHTECGVLGLDDNELRLRLQTQFGPAEQPTKFHGFSNLENSIREQMVKLKSHPWLRGRVVVRGFTYNVRTGALHEISED